MTVIIAMDGPAGAGKSTIAREVARALGFKHVDTGAMYRAVALGVLDRGLEGESSTAIEELASTLDIEVDGNRVWIDGVEASARIRGAEVNGVVSAVAARPGVRRHLADRQRRLAAGDGVVMEGRDIGSVVFPDAAVKLYLTAAIEERARRRLEELPAGAESSLDETAAAIATRDAADAGRTESPLVRAPDAVVVDSTGKDVREVVDQVLAIITRAVPGLITVQPEG
ncbi:MAG: (d)CMP kinase [Actinobacteria bacterium]|nr:(d)CMP kinase [Actinomycetota bacterium]